MSILRAENSPGLERRRPASPWDRGRIVHDGLATLLVGGGAAARTVARDLRRSPDYGLQSHRLSSTTTRDSGRFRAFQGSEGSLTCTRVVAEHNVEAIVIAIPSLPPAKLSGLVREAANTGAHVRFLPSFLSALERAARAADMRIVNFNSLLGRQERRNSQPAARAAFKGERVLVTGAGGSIGQELCRQIRSCNPASLHMLDHDESNLHTLQLELDGEALLDSSDVIIADIRDRARIRQVFQATRPSVVIHAAAHKHLPLLETTSLRGRQIQRSGDPEPRRGSTRGGRLSVRAHFNGQGGRPEIHPRSHEATCGDDRAGSRSARRRRCAPSDSATCSAAVDRS